jgi:ribonuclease HI
MFDEIPADWRDAKVADLVDEEGQWRVDDLHWLPSQIRDNIRGVVPPAANMGKDVCLWPGNSNGKFTVSSAYELMCMEGEEDDSQREVWINVWKLEVHERVRCFIWVARHGRILTNKLKHNMRLGEPFCSHCTLQVESILHVLRDCPLARVVWIHLVPMNLRQNFFDMELKQWFDTNCSNEMEDSNNIRWNAIWAMACHNLWQWRNKEHHDDNVVRPPEIWNQIRKMALDYKQAKRDANTMVQRFPSQRLVYWTPPQPGWVKLNTDGSSRKHGRAGCGGLIRGVDKEWLGGFVKNIGSCAALVAELWGVLEGLKFARSKGFNKVEVSVDSMAVINSVKKGNGGSATGCRLVQRIRQLMELDWEVNLSHGYREANRCANGLAKMSLNMHDQLVFFDSCPEQIKEQFDDDVIGVEVSTPRVIFL